MKKVNIKDKREAIKIAKKLRKQGYKAKVVNIATFRKPFVSGIWIVEYSKDLRRKH